MGKNPENAGYFPGKISTKFQKCGKNGKKFTKTPETIRRNLENLMKNPKKRKIQKYPGII